MATTAGDTRAMRPLGGRGSAWASPMAVLPVLASTAIRDGDVIVIDATTKYGTQSNSATTQIFGVAQLQAGQQTTSAAAIDADRQPYEGTLPGGSGTLDTINVAVAFPGARFEGSVINDAAASDETGLYADNVRKALEITESSDNFCCIAADASTNPAVFTLGYVRPQISNASGAFSYGDAAGVGLRNPRVEFVFLVSATVFSETVGS